MPITHAMRASRANQTITVIRHEDDIYTVEMITETDGEPAITVCALNREALVLLSKSLVEFIQNIDQFELDPEDEE